VDLGALKGFVHWKKVRAMGKRKAERIARRYYVSGRVQGVGFRWFVEDAAARSGVAGYTRNLSDGRVEVYAIGTPGQLEDLAGRLWVGPPMARVTGVEALEAPVLEYEGFRIHYA
jgi:acylphosphatase